MSGTVLVLGASGLFGSHAARAFAAAGWVVKRYQRGTDMNAAAQGADVIVNGLNPPMYHAWDKLIPEITAQVIAAARASGATVIVPGNVYVYGDQAGPWGPDTPHLPVARKGGIRAAMEATYKASGVQVIILRGGDFVAPDQPNSFWNMIALKGIAKGKVTSATGPDVKRAYAYLPDMARAAVALADKRESLPRFNDIPFAGFTLTMEEVAAAVTRLTGKAMRLKPFMWWFMKAAGPFWELARELNEMRYLFNTSHSLDPAPMASLLPDFRMTPLDQVLRDEIAVLAPELAGASGKVAAA